MKKCIIKDCEREGGTRGLCLSCYQAAQYTVQSGKTTWESLMKNGLSLGVKGGKAKFTAAFEEVKMNEYATK